jgi:sugar phosphate isomerase/epimerase
MGMTLDVAHAHLQGETYEFMRRFGDRIRHIHVSDNHGAGDLHLPVGDGSIDWGRVVSSARGAGFSGWLVVESYSDVEASLDRLRVLV